MPERLRRLEQTFKRLPIYFITACTHKRKPSLNDPDVHERLFEFGKGDDERGAWLGSYVLRPDHLHAFVIIDDEQLKLSAWIKSLKNALSKESSTRRSRDSLERLAVCRRNLRSRVPDRRSVTINATVADRRYKR